MSMKWGDLLLIQIFEVINNLDLISATPSAGSLYKDLEGGRFCSLPVWSHLAIKSIPSLTLESPLGFQNILNTHYDILPCGLSNYWILGLSVHSQTLLD